MATLHIEHAITDFHIWSEAFARFGDARRQAGVRSHRVSRPVDDERYVIVDLGFDTTEAAAAFLQFLHERVWAVPQNAPALAGAPQARILREEAMPADH
jgi:hypothetical protein